MSNFILKRCRAQASSTQKYTKGKSMKSFTIPFGPKVVLTKSAIAIAPINDAWMKKEINYSIHDEHQAKDRYAQFKILFQNHEVTLHYKYPNLISSILKCSLMEFKHAYIVFFFLIAKKTREWPKKRGNLYSHTSTLYPKSVHIYHFHTRLTILARSPFSSLASSLKILSIYKHSRPSETSWSTKWRNK